MAAHPYTAEELDEALALVQQHGSISAAARAANIPRTTMQSRVEEARRVKVQDAREGHAPGHFDSGVAPGYLMGKVTVQRNAGGDVERTWERQSPEDAEREERFRAFIEELSEGIKGLSPFVAPPAHTSDNLLVVYPIGDEHHGMRADARETGADWDVSISEHSLISAIDHLAAGAPPAKHALLINLGDFLHANDSKNATPESGARLDVDTRFGDVLHSGAMLLVQCVLRLLEKHETVDVWNMRGNHDPDAAMALAIGMAMYFHNEPRVRVDTGSGLYKYHRFGKNLIASHHGHGAKADSLPLIMAADRPEDWGQTAHRVFHCGHIHHKTVKDHPGCTVETHRTLAGSDAWHAGKGYRSKRDMQSIVYHHDLGEVQRMRFDMAMLTGS